jgi:hypothetical protein
MKDYKRALESFKEIPQHYLGEEVITPLGIGLIVQLDVPFNGLYVSPVCGEVVVWFSTERAVEEGIKWVNHKFPINKIKKIS